MFALVTLYLVYLTAASPSNSMPRQEGTTTDKCSWYYPAIVDFSPCSGNTPDRQGLLCYPACKPGYKGVLSSCWKGAKSYVRGFGVPQKAACPVGTSNSPQGNGVLVCASGCDAGYTLNTGIDHSSGRPFCFTASTTCKANSIPFF